MNKMIKLGLRLMLAGFLLTVVAVVVLVALIAFGL